ncbi:DUF427-domain-containing protein [Schizopora paradoxa]|uniref:DUF427-domain-containing protein n=1 Tax=Schizopora paradoxa TaxID=27342 RepID=A0A0H2RAS1_9AGAM|nr:DUF427-domain-containing protein [Schizopora paradoxa]
MAPPFTNPHIEDSLKRVRVLFGGKTIVDTQKAKLVWEKPQYPWFFFQKSDVPEEYLRTTPSDGTSSEQIIFDVVVSDKVAPRAAVLFTSGSLSGLIKLTFGTMDAWFEEEEQIFVHPKDPYKRVDVLQSARHVRIEVNGIEVANTTKPKLLFETSLHVRTYIPLTDCRLDLLEPSTLTTECPYKGVASYYSIRLPDGTLKENHVWWYRTPQAECIEIKGYLSFYDEKVDVWVDGVKQG